MEVTRRGGGVKRREINLASNQFPKCSPQPRTPKEIHRVGKVRLSYLVRGCRILAVGSLARIRHPM